MACETCEKEQLQIFTVSTIVGIALGAGICYVVMKRGR